MGPTAPPRPREDRDSLGMVHRFRSDLTELAEALHRGLAPPAGAVAAVNRALPQHRAAPADPAERHLAAALRARPPARGARGGRAIGGADAGRLGGPGPPLRRGHLFASSSSTPTPSGSRRWCCPGRLRARVLGRAPPGDAPADRSRSAGGVRADPGGAGVALSAGPDRRFVPRAGVVRVLRRADQAAGQSPGQLLHRRGDPRLVHARRRGAGAGGPPGHPAHLRRRGQRGGRLPGRQLDRRGGAAAGGGARAPGNPRRCWRSPGIS